jgi:hypothetical protein
MPASLEVLEAVAAVGVFAGLGGVVVEAGADGAEVRVVTTLFSSAAWAVLKSCRYFPATSAICHPAAAEAVAANCVSAF